MQPLQGPVVMQQFRRQILQQPSLNWSLAANPKITRCAYERFVKVMHPNAIRDHSAGQGIGRIRNSMSQFQPTAALLKWLPITSCNGQQELSWDRLSWSSHIASNQ